MQTRRALPFRGFSLFTDEPAKIVAGRAPFNAFTPAISQGQFIAVAPGGSATTTVTVNADEFSNTPPKGLMIVSLDNQSGSGEAQVIQIVR